MTFTGEAKASTEPSWRNSPRSSPKRSISSNWNARTAKLKLVRAAKDRWEVEWDATVPRGEATLQGKADPAAINELVTALLKAKPTTHPELSTNPAVHGLQPPGLKVTLRQGSERSSTINFGDVTSGGKGVAFVTTSARPSRPLADTAILDRSIVTLATVAARQSTSPSGQPTIASKNVFGETAID